jgi:hypothetical protein
MAFQNVSAQSDVNKWFDFWVGKWDGSWAEGEGKTGRGTNTITKKLDGTVIQEDFVITEGAQKGFLGMSISVLGATSKQWHQAWADNQGGYYNLVGERDGDVRVFKTLPRTADGKEMVQRMVFKDIKNEAFVWDWEKTEDGGKTWKLEWRINYKKTS